MLTEGLESIASKHVNNHRCFLRGERLIWGTSLRSSPSLFNYSAAVELNKKYTKAYLRRARGYEQLNQVQECLQGQYPIYRRIVKLDTNRPFHGFCCHFGWGQLWQKVQQMYGKLFNFQLQLITLPLYIGF